MYTQNWVVPGTLSGIESSSGYESKFAGCDAGLSAFSTNVFPLSDSESSPCYARPASADASTYTDGKQ